MTATQPPANAGRTRSTGALESSVLGILWQSLAELSVREVQAQLSAPRPSYSAVMTVLSRLEEKGQVARTTLSPRKIKFHPVRSESDHLAEQLLAILDRARDRQALLAGFAAALSPSEKATLRAALD